MKDEAEKTGFEERYFTDPECFERLLVAEDELIDSYLHDELSRDQRRKFEENFLASPRRRERVELARAFMNAIARASKRGGAKLKHSSFLESLSPFLRSQSQPAWILLAAACLAVVVVGGWLVSDISRLRIRLAQQEQAFDQQVALQRSQNERLSAEFAVERERRMQMEQQVAGAQPSRPAVVLSFILRPGGVRGSEGSQRLVVPSGTESLRLQLDIPAGPSYKSYRAILQTPEGNEIWSQDLRPGGSTEPRVVELTVPARVLAEGDYVVLLMGRTVEGRFEPLPSYKFSIAGG
jgi:hypothetical protein